MYTVTAGQRLKPEGIRSISPPQFSLNFILHQPVSANRMAQKLAVFFCAREFTEKSRGLRGFIWIF